MDRNGLLAVVDQRRRQRAPLARRRIAGRHGLTVEDVDHVLALLEAARGALLVTPDEPRCPVTRALSARDARILKTARADLTTCCLPE